MTLKQIVEHGNPFVTALKAMLQRRKIKRTRPLQSHPLRSQPVNAVSDADRLPCCRNGPGVARCASITDDIDRQKSGRSGHWTIGRIDA